MNRRLPLPALFALLLGAGPVLADGETPAFPGVEGAGRLTSGGRGGTIVHVTSLAAAGPGSLAEAVAGPDRIVIFDVSGIIDLARGARGGRIEVAHPNLTIAGQSAPGEGICLRGGALAITAPNVIVRHLRIRRGFVADGDTGDALMVKPAAKGEKTDAGGRTAEEFEKIRLKKLERGRTVAEFSDIDNIVIDHCSTSWATDENLTVTHAGLSTVGWCIAAEGLDYANPNQTPPRHSEGGLWGSAAADGRATLHHVLYAHNRLRNPRTTAGDEMPPVLTLFNNVVYNWSEHATHTGSQRVNVQWLANYYLPGPDTPAAARGIGFAFHGDPRARVYARGNVLAANPAATADNRLAVGFAPKLAKLTPAERAAMVVDQPFTFLPAGLTPAAEAFAAVLAESGATLPARDAVDCRLVDHVRRGTGRVIDRETDLAPAERWPDYRSLPPLPDADGDGLPDAWERQFGFDPRDPSDARRLGAAGYANIEHYLNNSDPRSAESKGVMVFIAGAVPRAYAGSGQAAAWRITRTGPTREPLIVRYELSGDATAGADFSALGGSAVIPAGASSVLVEVRPRPGAGDNRTLIATLVPAEASYFVGCPARALVVIRR